MDIYVKNHRPEATQREINNIGRVVMLIGATIAVFLALAINSIKGLNLFDVFQAILGFIAPPMSVVFLFGVLWKKTSTRAANFILSAGTLISIGTGIFYLWVFPSDQYTFWPHFLLLSFYIFVVLALAAFLITILDKKTALKDQNQLEFKYVAKPSKSVLLSWFILILTMISLYILFNGH